MAVGVAMLVAEDASSAGIASDATSAGVNSNFISSRWHRAACLLSARSAPVAIVGAVATCVAWMLSAASVVNGSVIRNVGSHACVSSRTCTAHASVRVCTVASIPSMRCWRLVMIPVLGVVPWRSQFTTVPSHASSLFACTCGKFASDTVGVMRRRGDVAMRGDRFARTNLGDVVCGVPAGDA